MVSRFEVVLALLVAPSTAFAEEIAGTISVVRTKVGSEFTGFGEVLVYLDDAPGAGGLPRGPFSVEQKQKSFAPSVLVVPSGATVAFPNNDEFPHNVFSTSTTNGFDLGLYGPGVTKSVVLESPGIVEVHCNVHPQMAAHVLVVTNPFFARPAADGSFVLEGVPPGTYHLVAWFPFGRPVREEVRVEAGKKKSLKIVLREVRAARMHPNKFGKPYSTYGGKRE